MRLLLLGADVLASNCTVTVPGSLRHLKALNTLIQGGAADVMKAIAVAVYERRPEVPGLGIVGLVYDEILATVPEKDDLAAKELIRWQLEAMREEIAGKNSSPLERLLSGRVVLTWLEVQYFEALYAQNMRNLTIPQAEHHQKRLDRAHRRHLGFGFAPVPRTACL